MRFLLGCVLSLVYLVPSGLLVGYLTAGLAAYAPLLLHDNPSPDMQAGAGTYAIFFVGPAGALLGALLSVAAALFYGLYWYAWTRSWLGGLGLSLVLFCGLGPVLVSLLSVLFLVGLPLLFGNVPDRTSLGYAISWLLPNIALTTVVLASVWTPMSALFWGLWRR